MRWLLPLLLAGCAQPAVPVQRSATRIVSTSPCVDAVLMAVAEPAQIRAISHYSVRAGSTSSPLAFARRFDSVSGTAEEVIARKPDLVFADSFTPAASRAAYARAGIRTITVGVPATIAESKAQLMQIATAVGAPERGRAMAARIDTAVARAAPADAARPALLIWHGGGLVSGTGTLLDEMIRIAGFRNAAADYGVTQTTILPLEQIALHPPRIMLTPPESDDGSRVETLRRRALTHSPNTLQADFEPRLTFCGGPTIVAALDRLAAIRRQVTP